MMGVGVEEDPILTRVMSAVDAVFTPDRIGPVIEDAAEPKEGPGILVMDPAGVELIFPFSDAEAKFDQLPGLQYGFRASLTPSGKILVTGGRGLADPSCWLLDPATLSLTTDGLPPPHPATRRYYHVSALLGDANYIIGGWDRDNDQLLASCFALRNSEWQPVATLPEAKSRASAAVCDETLFVLGSLLLGKQLLRLEAEADRWLQLGTPPRFRSLTSMDSILYALGGYVNSSLLWIYRPETDSWTQCPRPLQKTDTLTQCGGRLIAMANNSSVIQFYEPRTDSWEISVKERCCRGAIGA